MTAAKESLGRFRDSHPAQRTRPDAHPLGRKERRRADVAYLSYYALSARTSGGAALSRKLIDAGVFTDADYRAAQAMVTTDRLA